MHMGANTEREQEGSEVLAHAAQRAGDAPSLEAVKARLDGPWVFKLDDLQGPLQPQLFYDQNQLPIPTAERTGTGCPLFCSLCPPGLRPLLRWEGQGAELSACKG